MLEGSKHQCDLYWEGAGCKWGLGVKKFSSQAEGSKFFLQFLGVVGCPVKCPVKLNIGEDLLYILMVPPGEDPLSILCVSWSEIIRLIGVESCPGARVNRTQTTHSD